MSGTTAATEKISRRLDELMLEAESDVRAVADGIMTLVEAETRMELRQIEQKNIATWLVWQSRGNKSPEVGR